MTACLRFVAFSIIFVKQAVKTHLQENLGNHPKFWAPAPPPELGKIKTWERNEIKDLGKKGKKITPPPPLLGNAGLEEKQGGKIKF